MGEGIAESVRQVVSSSAPAEVMETAAADLRSIEGSVSRAAVARHSTRIGAAARHVLEAGGKRVRGLLTCAAMRALGRDPAPRIDVVAAVEIVHAGSLLHDDIIDASDVRRGRPAAHVVFDAHTAVLAGDLLLAWAFDRLARDAPRDVQVAMAGAVRDLSEGEVLERERRFDAEVDLDHARRVNRLKTAALFAYAAEAGAVLAGADPTPRHALRRFGLHLGEAFQTVDDLLDWQADPDALGKPTGRDLLAGTVTVPVALGLDRDPAIRLLVAGLWAARDRGADPDGALEDLRARLAHCGALDAARALAAADAAAAAAALDPLPAGPWRDRLASVAAAAPGRSR
jgi:octaprenyl-diphosphate synthase